jgi:asparagine synthase (glutamine-hydrolysing)
MLSGLALEPGEPVFQEVDGNAGVAVSSRFAGQQIYRDESVLVACDLELSNEDELKAMTPAPGGAALVAALYKRFGPDCVARLHGGFSVLLWDRREKKLIAAVDHFGIHRLAYCDDGRTLLMATRIDALLHADSRPVAVNPRAIANLVNFTVTLAPETVYHNVWRVQPGQVLTAFASDVRSTSYWDMRYGTGTSRDESRLARELESLVQQAVAANCHGLGAAESGAFLSGGTDSSTVVGMMSRVQSDAVNAFSIGFEEQSFNELSYAKLAATRFSARHHTHFVAPHECFEALQEMVRHFDEPFANASAIPTYFCARLAAQRGVRTLLAGDGGDELFGGNERYKTDKIFQVYGHAPWLLRKGLIEPALRMLPARIGVVRRGRGYVRRASMPTVERFLSFMFLKTHDPREIFEDDFIDELGGYTIVEVPQRYYDQAQAREDLDRLLYIDVKMTLGDSDLPKVTRMCEMAGIRARFPLLDPAVAEFSGRIPADLKVKGFEKRYLFKRAFRDLLPIEIRCKTKHGFGIPVSLWLKSYAPLREMARDLLLSPRAAARGYFRRSFVEELFRQHEADDSSYYGDAVWTFLVIELWHRQFVDQPVRVTT